MSLRTIVGARAHAKRIHGRVVGRERHRGSRRPGIAVRQWSIACVTNTINGRKQREPSSANVAHTTTLSTCKRNDGSTARAGGRREAGRRGDARGRGHAGRRSDAADGWAPRGHGGHEVVRRWRRQTRRRRTCGNTRTPRHQIISNHAINDMTHTTHTHKHNDHHRWCPHQSR
jgi:hypothetical protein